MRFPSNLLSVAIAATLVVSLHASSALANADPAARALGLLDDHPSSAQRNTGDMFSVRDVMIDSNGTEHVRMDRTYKGLPVFGGDIVVHSRNGSLKSISKTMKSALRPSLHASINADQAIDAAGAAFGSGIQQLPTVRKVIYARDTVPLLAWEVRLQGVHANGASLDMTYFVNATSGQLLLGFSNVMFAKPVAGASRGGGGDIGTTPGSSAIGTGRSLMNGPVVLDATASGGAYNLTDVTRGGSATFDARNLIPGGRNKDVLFVNGSNAWGDHTMSDNATVAADAHYGMSKAWDYFSEVHGRRGAFGDGKGSKVYVHVRANWANASWQNNAIHLGDGDGVNMRAVVSLDLIAHELSHGVTEATAKLVYSGESGGLNEATSDIFGSMAEFHANNPDDAPDYTIGEKLMLTKAAGRYLYKPSLDGKSPDCFSSAVASMNPHQSSGIGNHFFYLLAEGAVAPGGSSLSASDLVCNGNTGLRGIGRDAAQSIWYQALTRYMTSSTNYAAARAATLQASADLFGAGSVQQQAVAAAWSAVSVN